MKYSDKKKYIQAAEELCYSAEVIEKVKAANSEDEISQIMWEARVSGFVDI